MLKEKGIVPIIDICNKWKDGEETHPYKNTQLVYNYKGDVFYVPDKGEQIKLPTRDTTNQATVCGMDSIQSTMTIAFSG